MKAITGFKDKVIMHIGCKIYAFENWDRATDACDLFCDYTDGKISDFETSLNNMGILFEVVTDNCLLTK